MSSTEATPQDPALAAHIADAAAWYRHAEIIVQQRLYNFLMAASLLILAAATSLSASAHSAQQPFILTVSAMGLLLSLGYAVLGHRHVKFIDLHMNIVESLEAKLLNPDFRVITPIAKLRREGNSGAAGSGSSATLSALEMKLRSSFFLYAAPLALASVFGATLLYGVFLVPSCK